MSKVAGVTEARRVNGVLAEAAHAALQPGHQHDIRKSKRLSPTDPVNIASKRPCERSVLADVTNKKRADGYSRVGVDPLKPIPAIVVDQDFIVGPDEKHGVRKRLTFGIDDCMDVEAIAPITDIDAADAADPYSCCEYAPEIYAFLKTSQSRYTPSDKYMEVQTDLHPSMRSILVDWLVEVAEEYKLASETLYLCVNYVDRYLSEKKVVRGKLQLLGVVCMLLASKFEEVYAPAVDEFVYISDNTYTKKEIFELETLVLGVLKFNLAAPTVKTFLRRYVKAAGSNAVVAQLANYLCELSLHEYSFIKYEPSMTAAAAVSLALHTLGQPAWTPTLEHYTSFNLQMEDMQNCISEMLLLFERCSAHPYKAVAEKYARSKYSKVSTMAPPATTPPW
eukprot:TRINITY_DN18628_c0_g1_i1.p1 TRINITY_DN18628_c0_g1~~TRINITY_DN18628_c0_g1_i1.p1  ORF type:complete len:393 (+),score=138.95 TRINITY_DN18628_c0_g1_i1:166-1344(+)